MNDFRSIDEYLSEARAVIDGEINCHTPEYRALDLLHRAIEVLMIATVGEPKPGESKYEPR